MSTLKEDILKLVEYKRDTGELFWSKKRRGVALNKKCGSLREDGYIVVQIDKIQYLLHHIIWLIEKGSLPSFGIDHKNGIKNDNRIGNLRDVPQSLNAKNSKKHKHNTSGIMGVGWHKKSGKYRAYIKVDNINIHLGLFADFFEACCARKSAEVKYGFYKNHGK